MRYSDVVRANPIAVRKDDAAAMVGGKAVLEELLTKNLIRPRIARHKLTVFDVEELKIAWNRLTQTPGQSPGH